ncbi:MAG: hypothetical protein PHD48_10880 [Alphaproteobacteria bacterium]|nr:hypothetical protein [Alphaproteobacteria bacterium]
MTSPLCLSPVSTHNSGYNIVMEHKNRHPSEGRVPFGSFLGSFYLILAIVGIEALPDLSEV